MTIAMNNHEVSKILINNKCPCDVIYTNVFVERGWAKRTSHRIKVEGFVCSMNSSLVLTILNNFMSLLVKEIKKRTVNVCFLVAHIMKMFLVAFKVFLRSVRCSSFHYSPEDEIPQMLQ